MRMSMRMSIRMYVYRHVYTQVNWLRSYYCDLATNAPSLRLTEAHAFIISDLMERCHPFLAIPPSPSPLAPSAIPPYLPKTSSCRPAFPPEFSSTLPGASGESYHQKNCAFCIAVLGIKLLTAESQYPLVLLLPTSAGLQV